MPISILLADASPIVRSGLRAAFIGAPDIVNVAEACDGLEAIKIAERLQPSVMLVDIRLPGLNGLDVLSIVRKRAPATRLVVFSTPITDESILRAFASGAAAFISKHTAVDEVVAAVRRVIDGQSGFVITGDGNPPISPLNYPTTNPPDPHDALTARERQVLHLVAEGIALSEAAHKLSISQRTAEMHRRNAMKKLDLRSAADLIRYALRRGMIAEDG